MGQLYWSQASILSNLSGWSRFRFFFTAKSPGGKYIHRVWLWAYSFHDILFIAGQVWIYYVVHTPIHNSPAIVILLFSLLDQWEGTHFFIHKFFSHKSWQIPILVYNILRITFYSKSAEGYFWWLFGGLRVVLKHLLSAPPIFCLPLNFADYDSSRLSRSFSWDKKRGPAGSYLIQ